jgi:diguanylate cyclase (GGDEF)-like protein
VTERETLEQRLAAANERLSVLARQDALTGLANRRWFDEVLEQEFRRAARAEASLAVLLIDVDRFKSFNDTYGHQAGDKCLQAIALALTSSVHRPQDLVARHGGEEFAVLLPDANADGAIEVALAIEAAIEAVSMPHAGSSWRRVTSSIGLAATIPRLDHTPADLLSQADTALYRAKHDGRNRICCAPAEAMAV